MPPNDLAGAGLASDIVGALVLARGLMISKDDAVELGLSFIQGAERSTERDPLPMRDRLRQSRNASFGLLFLTAGFCLQLLSYVLPQTQPVAQTASGPQQLAVADLGKLLIRDVRPTGDSVRGNVYNGTDRVVSAMVVQLGFAHVSRFVLADPFTRDRARATRALRTDLARGSRSYLIHVHAPPLSVSRFAFPILDRADTVTSWKILSAEGWPGQ